MAVAKTASCFQLGVRFPDGSLLRDGGGADILTLPTTSNVLAGQLAGDGTIFDTTLIPASVAGTLTLPTPKTQTANTVLAGPTSGGAAAPTFRALVAADIAGLVSNAWSTLTGVLSVGQVIPYADAGISRLGASSLAVGNGTNGDIQGSLALAELTVNSTPNSPNWMYQPGGFNPNGPTNNLTGDSGFNFTVLQNIVVSQLGRKFLTGNANNHVVSLWSNAAGGTLLASVNVLLASVSDANGFKYGAITPVTLVPGVTYSLLSDETNGGDTWVAGVANIWLTGLFGLRTVAALNLTTPSAYPNFTNGTGTYNSLNMIFTVGPHYTVGLTTDRAGQLLIGNGTNQDFSGTVIANGGFGFETFDSSVVGSSSNNIPQFLFRKYPGQPATQIVGDFGNSSASRNCLVLTNTNPTAGSCETRLMLETSDDTGTFPNRGFQVYHRKGFASALVEQEALDILFFTTPTVGGSLTSKMAVTHGGAVNLTTGVPLQWNADSSISRLGAASLALGNGAQGNFSGSLKLTGLSVQGALTDGSASVGTAGQILSSTGTKVQWVTPGGAGTGQVVSYVSKSGNYALTASDYVVVFTATATATLPAAPATGTTYRIKNTGTGTVTVTPAAGLIDGAANAQLSLQYQSIDAIWDGANWWIL